MDNEEYKSLGLYEHNIRSFEKVKDAFLNGQDVVGIVHATGTGKSFNALQIAYESPDASIIYVVPSVSIIEHLKEIIEENPNLSLEKDFPNLKFITYQGLINMNHEEMEETECDLLILDEFHHIGAPVWGAKVDEMLETHPEMKIFGMTAYTVRDRGTSFERDMANPDTNEIFSNRIVSRYDLADAIIEGVLPKPVYKSAYFNAYLLDYANRVEEIINSSRRSDKQKADYMSILTSAKKRIHEAPSLPEIFKKNLKVNGKYIYFCPPVSEDGVNDIETIKNQTIEYLKGFIPENQIEVYITTAEMGKDGKLNRDAFYHDKTINGENASNKFRIMFAINQYNEGVHAPNIDGVIMGRGTSSDIVFFEHLGRALSVRGNTEEKYNELDKYTYEELIDMCKNKDIKVEDGTSKKEVIEKLLAPMILDLTNNYGYMMDLQDNLKERIKERQKEGLGNERDIKIDSVIFDIEIENKELFDLLDRVKKDIFNTWEENYELAKSYYAHNGNLEIPVRFKTINGYEYDENGVNLGQWINCQRMAYNGKIDRKITRDKIELLEQIGMRWNNIDKMDQWMEWYKLAKAYYEHYGKLEITSSYKTINGYEYDENGVNLGQWICTQRNINSADNSKIIKERINLLNQIGMCWDRKEDKWMNIYSLAKEYYNHYGNLEVPEWFKTTNGYEKDENGVKLGIWISRQRSSYKGNGNCKITKEQIDLLNQIGMLWDRYKDKWMNIYNLAKEYYNHYGNLEVQASFKTTNGYEKDENGVNLGLWITNQRLSYKGNGNRKLTKEQIDLLNQIGMRWDNIDTMYQWMNIYSLAKEYYNHYGNLEVPEWFKTVNGYETDENGVNIGLWVRNQRRAYNGKGHGEITKEKYELLNAIGMRWDNIDRMEQWMEKYNIAKAFYENNHNLKIPKNFKTLNGIDYDSNGLNLEHWIINQRRAYNGEGHGEITKEKYELLNAIGMRWDNIDSMDQWMNWYNLAKSYYEHHGDLKVPNKFKTINGYEYDEKGVNLAKWLEMQNDTYKGKYKRGLSMEQINLLNQIGIQWYVEKTDDKLQSEEINDSNKERKEIEILNRTRSLLNTYDGDSLPSKDEINDDFMDRLNRIKK